MILEALSNRCPRVECHRLCPIKCLVSHCLGMSPLFSEPNRLHSMILWLQTWGDPTIKPPSPLNTPWMIHSKKTWSIQWISSSSTGSKKLPKRKFNRKRTSFWGNVGMSENGGYSPMATLIVLIGKIITTQWTYGYNIVTQTQLVIS